MAPSKIFFCMATALVLLINSLAAQTNITPGLGECIAHGQLSGTLPATGWGVEKRQIQCPPRLSIDGRLTNIKTLARQMAPALLMDNELPNAGFADHPTACLDTPIGVEGITICLAFSLDAEKERFTPTTPTGVTLLRADRGWGVPDHIAAEGPVLIPAGKTILLAETSHHRLELSFRAGTDLVHEKIDTVPVVLLASVIP